MPDSIPILSFNTFAIGAKQLVVQEALETIVWFFFNILWLTPYTIVASTSFPVPGEYPGPEIRTFFAPALICNWASSLEVKWPVHSKTKSTPKSFQ